jgi:hypothetical protein
LTPGGDGWPLEYRDPSPLVPRLNVFERVRVSDRAAPRVFISSPGDTEGRDDHANHMESARDGSDADKCDEAQ